MSFGNIEGLMQRGQWDDAIVECKAVIQVMPGNPTVHAYLGMCYFRKEDWENAASELRLATILDPKFLDAGVKLAQVLHKLKRHLEAYDVAMDFLHHYPGNKNLLGLADYLKPYVDSRRIDGWERSIRVDTKTIEHVDS
jgi:tetratricopeptide (TPR) repeat protein